MIIPYHRDHFQKIELRHHEKDSFKISTLMSVAEKSITFTVLNEEMQIITIGGIMPNKDEAKDASVWEIWQCPSTNVNKNVNLFASAAHKLVEIARALGVKKLMTSCLIDDLHERWITFLKFKKVGETEIGESTFNRYERYL